ncbi:MAG TPA: TolC family protein, partial [Opitutaceae bacterium]|nr:TolC family protein [Opitutaceae bacterium]
GYTSKQTSYDRALNRLPHGDGYNWQVDLSLTFPWGNRAGNAAYHTALNNLRSQQTALEQLDQALVVEVRTDVRTVTTNLDSVKISTLSAELSEKQYELQKAKFDAGLSTSREVLQSQADLENARLSELQAKVSLRQAVSNLHQVEGSSLERYRVASPE